MPFGDRTGPRGEGALVSNGTGWGRGGRAPRDWVTGQGRWNVGLRTPLRIRRGMGRGGRWGGRGLNSGRGARPGGWKMADARIPMEMSVDEEARRLKLRAEDVKSELSAIEGRLAQLEAGTRKTDPGRIDD